MGVLVDVLYLINIPRLLTPRRRAPIANYLFMCVLFVTTLFFTLVYFTEMVWEYIVFIMIFILLFLIVFYNISKNKSDLEDEAIDLSIITTERDRAETETKIVDLQRKIENTSSITEKRKLSREVENLRQENAVRELEEERVFDTSLVNEIRSELKNNDKTDLVELDKKEKELQDKIEELERKPEKDRDVTISNQISALMARQKNIQDIKNRKIGYAEEKEKRVKKDIKAIDNSINSYNDSLTTLQNDKKEIVKKLKTAKGTDKDKFKKQLDSINTAIDVRKEDIELEKRKRKVLEDGRIDNLRGIEVYNKGANTIRSEAVANDGLIRLIEKNRLKRKATKADREVALRAQNRVDEREMLQETLDLGLALSSGREDADIDTGTDAGSCWVQLQEENFARLTTAQEMRLEDELEKQEAVDLNEDRIAIEKFEKLKDNKLLEDAAKFAEKYHIDTTVTGFDYNRLKNDLGDALEGINTNNTEERRNKAESAINGLFDENNIDLIYVQVELFEIMEPKDEEEVNKIKTPLSDADRILVMDYLQDPAVDDTTLATTSLKTEEKKKLQQYKLNRVSVLKAEETKITEKIKKNINDAKQNLLKSFETVEQKRDNLIQNNEELVKVRTRLDKIRRDTTGNTGKISDYFGLGINGLSDPDRTAEEVYFRADYDTLFDREKKKKITQDLAKDVEDNATATSNIIEMIRQKNEESAGDDNDFVNKYLKQPFKLGNRLRYNAVKRSLNRIENDAIGVSGKGELRKKVSEIKAPTIGDVGLATGIVGAGLGVGAAAVGVGAAAAVATSAYRAGAGAYYTGKYLLNPAESSRTYVENLISKLNARSYPGTSPAPKDLVNSTNQYLTNVKNLAKPLERRIGDTNKNGSICYDFVKLKRDTEEYKDTIEKENTNENRNEKQKGFYESAIKNIDELKGDVNTQIDTNNVDINLCDISDIDALNNRTELENGATLNESKVLFKNVKDDEEKIRKLITKLNEKQKEYNKLDKRFKGIKEELKNNIEGKKRYLPRFGGIIGKLKTSLSDYKRTGTENDLTRLRNDISQAKNLVLSNADNLSNADI
jgi:Ca2+/Na+ antiporter